MKSIAVKIAICATLIFSATNAIAQIGQVPEPGRDLGVNDKLIGSYIDADIKFNDDANNSVTIGDYLNKGKPVLLSFNYSNCPQLCNVQLSNMTFALKLVEFVPGTDFEIVSISIDPLEQSSRARETKLKYVTLYDNLETKNGWHFLTGENKSIKAQAKSVGVKYRYIPESKSYSHSAVFILLAPDGKIVRYIYGLNFEANDLKQALIEAAEGKIGSPINRGTYLTGCFVYDEFTGKYTFRWMNLMRWAGGFTVGIIVISIVSFEFFRRSKKGVASEGVDRDDDEINSSSESDGSSKEY